MQFQKTQPKDCFGVIANKKSIMRTVCSLRPVSLSKFRLIESIDDPQVTVVKNHSLSTIDTNHIRGVQKCYHTNYFLVLV